MNFVANSIIEIKILAHFDGKLPLPKYASSGASGADLCLSLPESERHLGLELGPWEKKLLPTGISLQIPNGLEGQIRPRSGLSLKTSLVIVNSPGTIDADYRGEVFILAANYSHLPLQLEHGLRIAQLVIAPVVQCEFLSVNDFSEKTTRGVMGFGSTGEKWN